ncbi:DNA damage-inducible protein 1, partial [Ascosphaera pollenicola]
YITVSVVKTNVPVPHDLITVDVAGDMTLQDLKAIIESETNVKPIHQHLFFNNVPLRDDEATFFSAGIKNGDVLAVHVRAPTGTIPSTPTTSSSAAAAAAGSSTFNAAAIRQAAAQSTQHPNMQDAETVRLQLLGDPRSLALVRAQNPEIADALHDPVRFTEIYNREKQKRMRAEAEKEARIAALNADPFNIEAQREMIDS